MSSVVSPQYATYQLQASAVMAEQYTGLSSLGTKYAIAADFMASVEALCQAVSSIKRSQVLFRQRSLIDEYDDKISA